MTIKVFILQKPWPWEIIAVGNHRRGKQWLRLVSGVVRPGFGRPIAPGILARRGRDGDGGICGMSALFCHIYAARLLDNWTLERTLSSWDLALFGHGGEAVEPPKAPSTGFRGFHTDVPRRVVWKPRWAYRHPYSTVHLEGECEGEKDMETACSSGVLDGSPSGSQGDPAA